jgi:DNA-binding transcriptional regulator LsrR (DeoR family)
MKPVHLLLVALSVLAGCVSIDLPGVVTDAAKVSKDAYRSVVGKGGDAAQADAVSNTYIGQDSQTAAEVKQLCVAEAAAKLFKAAGKEVPYTVTDNTITTVNQAIAANCKLVAAKAS